MLLIICGTHANILFIVKLKIFFLFNDHIGAPPPNLCRLVRLECLTNKLGSLLKISLELCCLHIQYNVDDNDNFYLFYFLQH